MTALALLALASARADRFEPAALGDLVNAYRQAHGVQSVSLNPVLNQAASGHATFMFENHVLTHAEDPAMKAFVGKNLEERAGKVGWTDECSELVGYASSGVPDSVQAIFDSPCHRARLLKPGSLSLGAAAAGDFVCLLFGGGPSPAVVVSPPDQATGIPTVWHGAKDLSGTRTGPNGREYGYPLVFIDTRAGDEPFEAVVATLSSESGLPVEADVRSAANDPHYSSSLAIVPQAALQPDTWYKARVEVTLADGRKDVRQWRFKTDH